jgi:pimeloyl-ACP methyl ester carboxylesterase
VNLGLRGTIWPEPSDDAGTSLAIASLRCRTASLRASRSPAVFRVGRPLALFLPDLLTDLPSACRTAAPLSAMFDVTVCELPGHGGSDPVADVSLPGLAQEYAAFIDLYLPSCRRVTLIGSGLGGLVALELARLRAERVARVAMLDAPVMLTRPSVAIRLSEAWRVARPAYAGRILAEVFGIDPETGASFSRASLCELAEDIDFPCAVLAGSDDPARRMPSMLADADLDDMHAANGALLIPARIEGAGHAILDDDPAGCLSTLGKLLSADQAAVAP